MAVRGPKPKPAAQRRHRNPVAADWHHVSNEPYNGARPDLPKRRPIMQQGRVTNVAVLPLTRAWW